MAFHDLDTNSINSFVFLFSICLIWESFALTPFFVVAQTANIDVSIQIAVCGNDDQEKGEDCDGSDLGGATCRSQGYASGTIACDASCSFDTSGCFGEAPDEEESTSTEQTANQGSSASFTGGGSTMQLYNQDESAVRISGRATPNSNVYLLHEGAQIDIVQTNDSGNFEFYTEDVSAGTASFSVYAFDPQGKRTKSRTVTLDIEDEATTIISNLGLPPTIAAKKRGQKELLIHGYSLPNRTLSILYNGAVFKQVQTNEHGFYNTTVDMSKLQAGENVFETRLRTRSYTATSFPAKIILSGEDVELLTDEVTRRADINGDGKISLADFSIAAYWYDRSDFPANVDVNDDGQIDLQDFSIMAFYWDG